MFRLPETRGGWMTESAVATAIFLVAVFGWDALPNAILVILWLAYAVLVVRGLVWYFREFKRRNGL